MKLKGVLLTASRVAVGRGGVRGCRVAATVVPAARVARVAVPFRGFWSTEIRSSVPEVSKADVEAMVARAPSPGEVLLDVRNEDELAYGMIPGAKHLPLGDLNAALELSDSAFHRAYGFDKPSADTRIVCYCRSGARSEAAVALLLARGFKETANYRGSFADWFGRLY